MHKMPAPHPRLAKPSRQCTPGGGCSTWRLLHATQPNPPSLFLMAANEQRARAVTHTARADADLARPAQ
eukprot:13882011-Alexandrium_andersonii.AAC.1